jgi:hypothetical protein
MCGLGHICALHVVTMFAPEVGDGRRGLTWGHDRADSDAADDERALQCCRF